MSDFTVVDHGTVITFDAETPAAQVWISSNLGRNAIMWGNGVVVESDQVDNLIQKITNSGLAVENKIKTLV
jgi:hypothetical protein